ncbi:MAG: MFS transporter [Saprospiraceae bacterium]|nr:MFS transporter [Saprospiraceae bacterium]
MDIFLTTMQVIALTVAGLCHALLGSIKVPLAEKLNINEDRVGGLLSAFGFTTIPMAFAAGILADSFGRQLVLGVAFLMLISSVLVLSRAKKYISALIAVLLLGIGWSALVNVLNVLQGSAFLPLFREGAPLSSAMNFGDFIFGMGAFIMPIAITFMLQKVQFRRTFIAFALLICIPLIFVFLVDWEPLTVPASGDLNLGIGTLLSDSKVLILCLAFFFYVGIEACTALWATTLMINRGLTVRKATTYLSVFWLTFTAARLVAALAMPPGKDIPVLIALAIGCIICTLVLALSKSSLTTLVAVIAIALIMAPIFPILIAQLLEYVNTHLGAELGGRSVGLFFSIGGFGWALVPLMVGKAAERYSVQKAFYVLAGSATLLTLLIFFAGSE